MRKNEHICATFCNIYVLLCTYIDEHICAKMSIYVLHFVTYMCHYAHICDNGSTYMLDSTAHIRVHINICVCI